MKKIKKKFTNKKKNFNFKKKKIQKVFFMIVSLEPPFL